MFIPTQAMLLMLGASKTNAKPMEKATGVSAGTAIGMRSTMVTKPAQQREKDLGFRIQEYGTGMFRAAQVFDKLGMPGARNTGNGQRAVNSGSAVGNGDVGSQVPFGSVMGSETREGERMKSVTVATAKEMAAATSTKSTPDGRDNSVHFMAGDGQVVMQTRGSGWAPPVNEAQIPLRGP